MCAHNVEYSVDMYVCTVSHLFLVVVVVVVVVFREEKEEDRCLHAGSSCCAQL